MAESVYKYDNHPFLNGVINPVHQTVLMKRLDMQCLEIESDESEESSEEMNSNMSRTGKTL